MSAGAVVQEYTMAESAGLRLAELVKSSFPKADCSKDFCNNL